VDGALSVLPGPRIQIALHEGTKNVFRSRNGGDSWQIVSPDLSRRTKAITVEPRPATLADTKQRAAPRRGVRDRPFADPRKRRLGRHRYGYIWLSRPSTGSGQALAWRNVTPPQLTSWSKVGINRGSHFDVSTAYAAVDRTASTTTRRTSIARPTAARRGRPSSAELPNGSFVNAVREGSEAARTALRAGTERGIYVSFDDGANWQPPAAQSSGHLHSRHSP